MNLQSQPKTFVISLSNTPNLSETGKLNKELGDPFLKKLLKSLDTYKWHYSIFDAFDGYLLEDTKFIEEQINIENHCEIKNQRGALGCLYSHLQIWKKSINFNEPIIVLEHDALVSRKFDGSFNFNEHLTKLGTPFPTQTKNNKLTGKWKMGAWGYLITPLGCQILIKALKKHGTIPVDVLMGDSIINWNYIEPPLCSLNQISLLQSSTNLRNEKRLEKKWTNPFLTISELSDWLKNVLKDNTLKMVVEINNKEHTILTKNYIQDKDTIYFTVFDETTSSNITFNLFKIKELYFYENN